MKDDVKALDEFVEPEGELSLEAPKDAKPIKLRDALVEMDLIGPHMKAEELKGETFSIYRAKPFQSMGGEDERAYFCHCVDLKNGEIFTTTLGGRAVVELLELYFKHGPGAPIQVTLNWNEGGAFGGYYTID